MPVHGRDARSVSGLRAGRARRLIEACDSTRFSTSLHGVGLDVRDHHVADEPGGGCIHDGRLLLPGADRQAFDNRVTAPDMATAHATSLLVAVGIVCGESPADIVAALNQAGFNVSVRFDLDQFTNVNPGPPDLVARLVDLIRASIDVASEGPGDWRPRRGTARSSFAVEQRGLTPAKGRDGLARPEPGRGP